MSILDQFQKRHRTYPQSVTGRFRKIRDISSAIFLAIYFFIPFIRWNRGEGIADQAILIDIPGRRIFYFFIEIWPEEVYYLTALLIFAAVALFFITSLFGRVWCGYSCPQTVWTDLFLKVEKFFQGDRNQRILLDRKSLSLKNFSLKKFSRKTATHITWIIISLVTGFGFTLYFNDAFILTKQLLQFNLGLDVIGWSCGIAFMTYIMAGFAREQVCNHMCPYSRFQSVMFDRDTLIISYDEDRGEPRSKYKIGSNFDNTGHCILCNQCVVVCPQDIDIRDGLQMECIACGMCVDACDAVMAKVGLPPGLIRYDTQHNLENKDKTKDYSFKLLKPRTIYYAVILTIIAFLIIFSLSSRANLKLNIIPTRNPLFVTLSDGSIRNSYVIKIQNKTHQRKSYRLKISNINNYKLKIQNKDLDANNLVVKADDIASFKIYLTVKKEDVNYDICKNNINFTIIDNNNNEATKQKTVFISCNS